MKNKPVDITKFGPNYVTLHRRQQLERELAYKNSAPEKTGLKVVTQQPPPKANVIDGKWGMGKWKWKTGASGLPPDSAVNFIRVWTPMFINGVQNVKKVELVTIQKKHLDEAVKAISVALASCAGCWSIGLKDIKLLEQALKNISVK